MTRRHLRIASTVAALVVGVFGTGTTVEAQQGWAPSAQALSPLGPEAGGAQLAFDAAGNGFAVWTQFDGAALTVWLARFDPSIGAWRLPGQQLSPLGQETLSPHVAVDGIGNALVAWIARSPAFTTYSA